MLVRLDPERTATAIMSLPRDLKVDDPGPRHDKINAAYSLRRPELTRQDGQGADSASTDQPRRQRQLRRLPAARSTRSAASTSTSTAATSTTTSGLRRGAALRGDRHRAGLPEALRHGRPRLRPLPPPRRRLRARRAPAELPAPGQGAGRRRALFSDREELLRIFGRYTQTDINARVERESCASSSSRCSRAEQPDPRGPVPGRDRATSPTSTVTDDDLRKTVGEFLHRQAPRPASDDDGQRRRDLEREARRRSRRSSRRAPPSVPGLGDCRRAGEDQARRDGADEGGRLPVYYPAVRTTRAGYADQPPTRALHDQRPRGRSLHGLPDRRAHARRDGQYWGVQGTSWRTPPILDDPRRHGQDARPQATSVYYDGTRLRLIAWRTATRRLLGVQHALARADEHADARASRGR